MEQSISKRVGGYSRQMVSGQTNLYGSNTINPVLAAKASAEVEWLNCIDAYSSVYAYVALWCVVVDGLSVMRQRVADSGCFGRYQLSKSMGFCLYELNIKFLPMPSASLWSVFIEG
jgi:hypothetical protein